MKKILFLLSIGFLISHSVLAQVDINRIAKQINAAQGKDTTTKVKEEPVKIKSDSDFYNSAYKKFEEFLDTNDGVWMRKGMFTTFIGIDINFAQERFDFFISADMEYNRSGYEYTDTYDKFIYERVVKYGQVESIEVTYYFKKRTDIEPYIKGGVWSHYITKVEIIGTEAAILHLYNRYWTFLSGDGVNIISNFNRLNDHVSLSTPSYRVRKIVITDAKQINYYTRFGINQPKN